MFHRSKHSEQQKHSFLGIALLKNTTDRGREGGWLVGVLIYLPI